MKKTILTTLVVLGAVASVSAQGVINFSTRVTGSVVGHIYLSDPSNVRVTGNTATETPAGTTVYIGGLAGAGISAELWQNTGAGFTAVPGSLTPVRTSASTLGTPTPLVLPTGFAIHTTGLFQVRAWDNVGGTVTSYAAALALPTGIAGYSDQFSVLNLGDGVLDFPADMLNFRSFNMTGNTIVPEPSTFVLAGLGTAALLIFRRRK